MARIMVRRSEIIGEIRQASTFEVEVQLPLEVSEFWLIFGKLLLEFQGQKIEGKDVTIHTTNPDKEYK